MNSNKLALPNTDEAPLSSHAAVFEALEHPLRRAVVSYLAEHECPVSVFDLAESVCVGETVSDDREIVTEFHHNHLPRLMDCGFIVYDSRTNIVERTLDAATLESSLSLISPRS